LTLFPHAGFDSIPAPAGAPAGSSYFKVSEQSRCFDGHFDGAPIFPGVAHVALALSACAANREKPGALAGLRELRFKRPLGPGDEVEVILTDGGSAASVRFEIRRLGESVSAGLLLFTAADGGSLG